MWAFFTEHRPNIVIAYDSTYAANCTQGLWTPRENVQLVEVAQRWLQLCQSKFHVRFEYVPAHTQAQDWWSLNNEEADKAAKKGARRLLSLHAWFLQTNRPEQAFLKTPSVLAATVPKTRPQQRTVPYLPEALVELDRRRKHVGRLQEQMK